MVDKKGKIRGAFASWEEDIFSDDAADKLQEAVDFAINIIEDPNSSDNDIEFSNSILCTYFEKLRKEVSILVKDHGSHDRDVYLEFFEMVRAFAESGAVEKASLGELEISLFKREFNTLSESERDELLKSLQRAQSPSS